MDLLLRRTLRVTAIYSPGKQWALQPQLPLITRPGVTVHAIVIAEVCDARNDAKRTEAGTKSLLPALLKSVSNREIQAALSALTKFNCIKVSAAAVFMLLFQLMQA